MKRELHGRICERLGLKCPCLLDLAARTLKKLKKLGTSYKLAPAMVIKEDDQTNKSRKYASYIPFWA